MESLRRAGASTPHHRASRSGGSSRSRADSRAVRGRARAALAGARADCLVLNHRLEEAAGVIERQAGRIAALEASVRNQQAETRRVRGEWEAALGRQLGELERAHGEQLRRLREQIQGIRGSRAGRQPGSQESSPPPLATAPS